MRLQYTIFGTTEFDKLSLHAKAAFIMNNQEVLESLGEGGLDFCSTILCKAMCECKLIEVITDESTNSLYGVPRKGHFLHCPAYRIPICEDYSVRTLLRRQKQELLMTNTDLIMLEQSSSSVRKQTYNDRRNTRDSS